MLPIPEQLPTAKDYHRATVALNRLFVGENEPRETIDRFHGNGLLRSRRGREFLQRVNNISGVISMGDAYPAWSHTEEAQTIAKAVSDGMHIGALLTSTSTTIALDTTPEHITRINRGLDVVLEAAQKNAEVIGSRAMILNQLYIAGTWGFNQLSTGKEIAEIWQESLRDTSHPTGEGMVLVGLGIIIDADMASRQGIFAAAQRRLHSEFNTIVKDNDLDTITVDTQDDWDKHWREFQGDA
ncbi:MAG: hypothetical protein WAR37_00180 [Candidatus Microsaccharimonas sp.]